MLELLAMLAAAAAPTETAEAPPINVQGQRTICRHVADSAQTRMNRQRVCRTQLEWDEIRDQASEFWLDMGRRNPRAAATANGNASSPQ